MHDYLNQNACNEADEADSKRSITYFISGKKVCKSFFRSACGVRRQSFDSIVFKITNGIVKKDYKPPKKVMSENEANIQAFLENHFKDRNVQYAPSGGKIHSNRRTFKDIYDLDYLPFCELSKIKAMSYSTFVAHRKHYCKNYGISQTCKRKGTVTCFVYINVIFN